MAINEFGDPVPWWMEVSDPALRRRLANDAMLRQKMLSGTLRPDDMPVGDPLGRATGGWGESLAFALKNPLLVAQEAAGAGLELIGAPGADWRPWTATAEEAAAAPSHKRLQGITRWSNREWWDRFQSTQPFFPSAEDKDTLFAVGVMHAVEAKEDVTPEELEKATDILRWNWRGKTSGHELSDTLGTSVKMGAEFALMNYATVLPKFVQAQAAARSLGQQGLAQASHGLWQGAVNRVKGATLKGAGEVVGGFGRDVIWEGGKFSAKRALAQEGVGLVSGGLNFLLGASDEFQWGPSNFRANLIKNTMPEYQMTTDAHGRMVALWEDAWKDKKSVLWRSAWQTAQEDMSEFFGWRYGAGVTKAASGTLGKVIPGWAKSMAYIGEGFSKLARKAGLDQAIEEVGKRGGIQNFFIENLEEDVGKAIEGAAFTLEDNYVALRDGTKLTLDLSDFYHTVDERALILQSTALMIAVPVLGVGLVSVGATQTTPESIKRTREMRTEMQTAEQERAAAMDETPVMDDAAVEGYFEDWRGKTGQDIERVDAEDITDPAVAAIVDKAEQSGVTVLLGSADPKKVAAVSLDERVVAINVNASAASLVGHMRHELMHDFRKRYPEYATEVDAILEGLTPGERARVLAEINEKRKEADMPPLSIDTAEGIDEATADRARELLLWEILADPETLGGTQAARLMEDIVTNRKLLFTRILDWATDKVNQRRGTVSGKDGVQQRRLEQLQQKLEEYGVAHGIPAEELQPYHEVLEGKDAVSSLEAAQAVGNIIEGLAGVGAIRPTVQTPDLPEEATEEAADVTPTAETAQQPEPAAEPDAKPKELTPEQVEEQAKKDKVNRGKAQKKLDQIRKTAEEKEEDADAAEVAFLEEKLDPKNGKRWVNQAKIDLARERLAELTGEEAAVEEAVEEEVVEEEAAAEPEAEAAAEEALPARPKPKTRSVKGLTDEQKKAQKALETAERARNRALVKLRNVEAYGNKVKIKAAEQTLKKAEAALDAAEAAALEAIPGIEAQRLEQEPGVIPEREEKPTAERAAKKQQEAGERKKRLEAEVVELDRQIANAEAVVAKHSPRVADESLTPRQRSTAQAQVTRSMNNRARLVTLRDRKAAKAKRAGQRELLSVAEETTRREAAEAMPVPKYDQHEEGWEPDFEKLGTSREREDFYTMPWGTLPKEIKKRVDRVKNARRSLEVYEETGVFPEMTALQKRVKDLQEEAAKPEAEHTTWNLHGELARETQNLADMEATAEEHAGQLRKAIPREEKMIAKYEARLKDSAPDAETVSEQAVERFRLLRKRWKEAKKLKSAFNALFKHLNQIKAELRLTMDQTKVELEGTKEVREKTWTVRTGQKYTGKDLGVDDRLGVQYIMRVSKTGQASVLPLETSVITGTKEGDVLIKKKLSIYDRIAEAESKGDTAKVKELEDRLAQVKALRAKTERELSRWSHEDVQGLLLTEDITTSRALKDYINSERYTQEGKEEKKLDPKGRKLGKPFMLYLGYAMNLSPVERGRFVRWLKSKELQDKQRKDGSYSQREVVHLTKYLLGAIEEAAIRQEAMAEGVPSMDALSYEETMALRLAGVQERQAKMQAGEVPAAAEWSSDIKTFEEAELQSERRSRNILNEIERVTKKRDELVEAQKNAQADGDAQLDFNLQMDINEQNDLIKGYLLEFPHLEERVRLSLPQRGDMSEDDWSKLEDQLRRQQEREEREQAKITGDRLGGWTMRTEEGAERVQGHANELLEQLHRKVDPDYTEKSDEELLEEYGPPLLDDMNEERRESYKRFMRTDARNFDIERAQEELRYKLDREIEDYGYEVSGSGWSGRYDSDSLMTLADEAVMRAVSIALYNKTDRAKVPANWATLTSLEWTAWTKEHGLFHPEDTNVVGNTDTDWEVAGDEYKLGGQIEQEDREGEEWKGEDYDPDSGDDWKRLSLPAPREQRIFLDTTEDSAGLSTTPTRIRVGVPQQYEDMDGERSWSRNVYDFDVDPQVQEDGSILLRLETGSDMDIAPSVPSEAGRPDAASRTMNDGIARRALFAAKHALQEGRDEVELTVEIPAYRLAATQLRDGSLKVLDEYGQAFMADYRTADHMMGTLELEFAGEWAHVEPVSLVDADPSTLKKAMRDGKFDPTKPAPRNVFKVRVFSTQEAMEDSMGQELEALEAQQLIADRMSQMTRLLFHWTPQMGTLVGRKQDLGMHFGTETAAYDRKTAVESGRGQMGVGRTTSAPLAIDPARAIVLPDLMDWHSNAVVDALTQTPNYSTFSVGTKAELAAIRHRGDMQNERIAELLRKEGYDHVVYENSSEDPGSLSYIVLDPSDLRLSLPDPSGTSVLQPVSLQDQAQNHFVAARILFVDQLEGAMQFLKTAAQDPTTVMSEGKKFMREWRLSQGKAMGTMRRYNAKHVIPMVYTAAKHGINLLEINAFLRTRHQPERNAYIKTINPKKWAEIEADPETSTAAANREYAELVQGRAKGFNVLGQKWDAYMAELLQDTHKAGLITDDDYATYKGRFKRYAPMQIVGEYEMEADALNDRSMQVIGKQFASITGTTQKSSAQFEYGIHRVMNFALRASNKAVLGHLVKFDAQNKHLEIFMPEETSRGKIVRDERGTPTVKYTKGPKPYDDSLVPTDKRNRYRRFNLNVQTIEDGEVVTYRLNQKYALLGRSILNLDRASAMNALAYLSTSSRTVAQLNTRFNPAFAPFNMGRDYLHASAMITGEHGLWQLWGSLNPVNYRKAQNAIKRYQRSRLGKNLTPEGEIKPYRKNKYDDYTLEYMEETGAEVTFYNALTIEALASQTERKIGRISRGLTPDTILEIVTLMNDRIENSSRLAHYVSLREKGASKDDAALEAKELTVNFERKGEVGAYLNAFFLFAQAGTTGVDRIAHMIRHNPARATALLGTATMAGAVLDWWNRSMMGEDDEGRDIWDTSFTEAEKRTDLIFATGMFTEEGDPVTIRVPGPWGVRWFPYLGQSLGAMFSGKKDASDFGADVVTGAFMELNPIGESLWPWMIKPFVENAQNKNHWGTPIYQDPKFLPYDQPASELYFDSVNPFLREMTTALNRAGRSDIEKDMANKSGGWWYDWNPEKIEHLIGSYAGGAGKFVGRIFNVADKMMANEPITVSDIPVLRRLYKEGFYEGKDRELFYAIRGEAKRYMTAYEKGTMTGYDQELADTGWPHLTYSTGDDIADQLSEIRKVKKVVKTAEEKKQLAIRERNLMSEYLAIWYKHVEPVLKRRGITVDLPKR